MMVVQHYLDLLDIEEARSLHIKGSTDLLTNEVSKIQNIGKPHNNNLGVISGSPDENKPEYDVPHDL